MGVESDKGNFLRLRSNYCGVLTLAPHGDNPLEGIVPYPVDGHQGRGEVELHGFLPPLISFSGLSIVRVTGEVSYTSQDMGILHVQALVDILQEGPPPFPLCPN